MTFLDTRESVVTLQAVYVSEHQRLTLPPNFRTGTITRFKNELLFIFTDKVQIIYSSC